MTEIPDNLKSAMEQYANIKVELENDIDIQLLNASVDSLLVEVNNIEQKIQKLTEPSDKKLKEIDEYIRGQVLELEITAKHAGVVATYSKPHSRTNWISKKMTDICMNDPELLERVTSARSVKEYPAKVAVTYEPEPIPEKAPF